VNFFGNSYSIIATEREIGDLRSGQFRFAKELQLSFLNLSSDRLVEDSDVGKLLDPPPSLVMMNSRSETR